MGFPRRRSLWLKVALLATAVWLTVCFLLYTEDRTAVVQGLAPSGVAMPQAANGFVPPAAPSRKETPGAALNRAKINQAGPEQGNLGRARFSFLCGLTRAESLSIPRERGWQRVTLGARRRQTFLVRGTRRLLPARYLTDPDGWRRWIAFTRRFTGMNHAREEMA